MAEIIFIAITLAVLAVIGICMIVSNRRKHSLFPDDGIVWPESLEDWAKK